MDARQVEAMDRRVRLTAGLGATDLSEETAVLIAIDYGKKGLEASDFRVWRVSVPLEVSAHPEYAPAI